MKQQTKKHLLLTGIGIILIIIFYKYIDKPVAFAVHDYLSKYTTLMLIFYCLEHIANVIFFTVPILYIYLFTRYARKLFSLFDKFLFSYCTSIVTVVIIKDLLKGVFGRYWPQTYINGNLSLIGMDAYGFNFFHTGLAYQSFPSGHTCVIFAAMTVVWLEYPKLKWLAITLSICVMVGLIGLDYHFVSDVIAGMIVGITTGRFTVGIIERIEKMPYLP
ncbi:MAG TPA: phosphatase PAP2 family protein [Victivallales bacterium]|nr:phosphatase PAP2 family protein [Victivallales bacterium]